MGSATREALASAIAVFTARKGSASLETGDQLLQAGRAIGESPQLLTALADNSAKSDEASGESGQGTDKHGIIGALFGSFTAETREVLDVIVDGRWSSERDLLAGIEELGIRAVADSAPAKVSIESELFEFERAVRSNSELELAISSSLGTTASKVSLIESLLGDKASKQTLAILRHLVQQPRGRRIGELLRDATSFVADQAGLAVATVTVAAPIAPKQLERLAAGLAKQYGKNLRINQVVDPAIIGGIRVQIGDDVIDGSVASKINDLRLRLAS